MKANKLLILRDFIGQQKILFKIPVYQRNYDWSEDNCKKLLSDIQNIIITKKQHFLGAIVYMSDYETFALSEYMIIDGQQRLTTMMILLKALADIANDNNDSESEKEINDCYLHNLYCDEEFKVKLKPIESDNNQFLLLLNNSFNEINKDSHIYRNYDICKKTMSKWIENKVSVKEILEALNKLEIVEIALTKGEDDPQIIFESINSTGLDLSNSDLIRNFLLMNTDKQDELYKNYWLHIENKLKEGNDYKWLNSFFMHYLAFKLKKPIVEKRIYEMFVELYKTQQYTQEKILKELKYFSDIYADFIYDNNNYCDSIKYSLRGLRQLQQTTCYPFLLYVFDDYKNKVITEETLNKTLKLILSYLLRRMVCGVPTHSLRSLFIYMYNRVFKVTENKEKYYKAINKYLFTLDSKDVIPSEQEFEERLKTIKLFKMYSLCRFLLGDIENQNGKEVINVSDLTVEHIMPQTLSVGWTHILPKDHEEYMHTLGNLTVTGYNSELSNKSFAEKKDIIKENSKAVRLNEDVLNKDIWDIQTIKDRANRLIGIIKNRYNIEEIKDDDIHFQYITKMTLDDIDNVKGKKLESFTFNGGIYTQNKFILMLQDIFKLLDKINNTLIYTLADTDFSRCISRDPGKIKKVWNFKDDIYVEQNLSTSSIINLISKLMEKFNIEKKNFSFNVIDDEKDNEDENSEEYVE